MALPKKITVQAGGAAARGLIESSGINFLQTDDNTQVCHRIRNQVAKLLLKEVASTWEEVDSDCKPFFS